MSEIQKYDKNFQQGSKINKPDLCFYDALQPPFSLHGVYYDEADGRFRRMPGEVAATVSPGVAHLHRNTAGGRLRFRSSGRYVAIRAEMDHIRGRRPTGGKVSLKKFLDGLMIIMEE